MYVFQVINLKDKDKKDSKTPKFLVLNPKVTRDILDLSSGEDSDVAAAREVHRRAELSEITLKRLSIVLYYFLNKERFKNYKYTLLQIGDNVWLQGTILNGEN